MLKDAALTSQNVLLYLTVDSMLADYSTVEHYNKATAI